MSALCREVCLSLKDKEEKKYKYSKDAMRDMRHSLQLIQEMFTKAVQMMATGNTEDAKRYSATERKDPRSWYQDAKIPCRTCR